MASLKSEPKNPLTGSLSFSLPGGTCTHLLSQVGLPPALAINLRDGCQLCWLLWLDAVSSLLLIPAWILSVSQMAHVSKGDFRVSCAGLNPISTNATPNQPGHTGRTTFLSCGFSALTQKRLIPPNCNTTAVDLLLPILSVQTGKEGRE